MISQTVLAAKDHQQERRSRPRRKEKYVPVSITSVPKKAANNQKIYQVQIILTNPSGFYDEASGAEDKGGALDDLCL